MSAITQDEAEEIVMGYDGHVTTQDVEEHRWYTTQLVVFERDGATLGFHYLKPASELQEDQDRFESDPVEVFPVVGCLVTRTVYERAS